MHLIGYFISAGNITDEVYAELSGFVKVILTFYPNIGKSFSQQIEFSVEFLQAFFFCLKDFGGASKP